MACTTSKRCYVTSQVQQLEYDFHDVRLICLLSRLHSRYTHIMMIHQTIFFLAHGALCAERCHLRMRSNKRISVNHDNSALVKHL